MKIPISRDKFATSPVRAQFYDYLLGLDEIPTSRELAARFNTTFETVCRWRRSLGLRTKAQAERAQNLERAIRYLKNAEPTTYTEMCLALGFPRFNVALADDLRKFRPDLAARFKKTRQKLSLSKERENEYDVEVEREMSRNWEWDEAYKQSLHGRPGFRFGGEYWDVYRKIWESKKDEEFRQKYGILVEELPLSELDEDAREIIEEEEDESLYNHKCRHWLRDSALATRRGERRRRHRARFDDLPGWD